MGLLDREYMRPSSEPKKRPSPKPSNPMAYDDYLKDNGFVPDDGKRHFQKQPDLSGTKFNSSTGELEFDESKPLKFHKMSVDGFLKGAGFYVGRYVSPRKPIIEIDSRERVNRQRLNKLKSSLDSKKNTVQKPFPAWVSFLFVVVGLSFLVAVLDDLFR